MNVEDINYEDMVRTLIKPGEDILASLTPEKCDLWHVASAAPGEASELFDAVKKYVIYGKTLDRENIIEELGDLKFFVTRIMQILGITAEEVERHNILKLSTRYKFEKGTMKYSDEAARDRADKA
jgi:NTP pyrophosphatase (non-canonical NTP hydrolase)